MTSESGSSEYPTSEPGFAAETNQQLRLVEAILFAAAEPLDEATIAARLPDGSDVAALIEALSSHYANRGVNVVRVAGKWALRTAPDLASRLRIEQTASRRLSRAAVETLAIICYHQPVTRAEIEDIRGVAVNRGTLDVLLEAGWIRPGRRRRAPGRPVTWVTTEGFLGHFQLDSLLDLPGQEELKAAGLLRGAALAIYRSRAGEGELPGGILAEETAEEEAPDPLVADDRL